MMENTYPQTSCAEKKETIEDMLNEIIFLAVENKRTISHIFNSFRKGATELPEDEPKLPQVDKIDKLDIIRRLLRDNNETARTLEEVIG